MRIRNKELRSRRHRKEQTIKEAIRLAKAGKSAPKAESKTVEAAPKPKVEAKPKAEPKAKAEAKPKAEPKAKVAAKPKADVEAKPKKAPAKKKAE